MNAGSFQYRMRVCLLYSKLYDRFSKELPFLQSEKLVSIKIQTDKTIAEYTIGTSERPTSTSALLWSPACAIFL